MSSSHVGRGSGTRYTVAECEDRIDEIDNRLERLRNMTASRKSIAGLDFDVGDKIEQLEHARSKWERRLEAAKSATDGDRPTSRGGLQTTDSEVH